MCGIAWCSFTWEAFATLTTGALAVGAAVWVGRRQTKIQDRQVELEQMKLRSDLFDRRMKVYEATISWLRYFWQHGKSEHGGIEGEFIWAIDTAKFLFRPAVSDELERWRRIAIKHHYHQTVNEHEKATVLLMEIAELANTVNSLFAEEMRLTDMDGKAKPAN